MTKTIICKCGAEFQTQTGPSGIVQSKYCNQCRFDLEIARRKAKNSKVLEVDIKEAKTALKSKIKSIRKVNYSPKTVPQLLKILTEHFNTFIRNRDKLPGDYFFCPTCGKTKVISGDNYQACHCFPSTYSALRFNENNVWGGCKSCNFFKHGAGHEYNDWVRNKIGEIEYQKLLILKRENTKWDRFNLIFMIEKYRAKNKEYERLAGGEMF